MFDIAELREVTAYDELELDTLGDRKTALFLIMSDTDDILLVIAFLISPYGLPMAAIWLLGKVQDLKFIIQDLVYG